MEMLKISPSEFYDLSPLEFYYAAKAVGEARMAQVQVDYEISRYNALLVINNTSTILKERYKDPRELSKFTWEKDVQQIAQTPEQLQKAIMGIASAFKANTRVKEDMDGPPLHLVAKNRK